MIDLSKPINYERTDYNQWCDLSGDKKIEHIKNKYPYVFRNLSKNQLKTISGKQCEYHWHFGEIVAMNHFIKNGCEVYYIESGYITEKHEIIKSRLKQLANALQQELIFKSKKGGGIPDLLVISNNDWMFVEVKLHYPDGGKDRLNDTQKDKIQELRKARIKVVEPAEVVPFQDSTQ